MALTVGSRLGHYDVTALIVRVVPGLEYHDLLDRPQIASQYRR